MLDADMERNLARELEENNVLMIDNRKSRQRYILEIKRRFLTVPRSFWLTFQNSEENAQRLALFFVIMKCYRLVFDLHINVTLKKWYSIDRRVTKGELMMELSQIAANDEYVDSWSDWTRTNAVYSYLTILHQAGLYTKKTGELRKADIRDEDYLFYLRIGEGWFLEACFLQPYEINRIKQLNTR